MLMLSLAVATLASEDLTCMAAGFLIAEGKLSLAAGVFGCALGILAGDCGLWALGRVARGVCGRWAWTSRLLARARVEGLRAWVLRHPGRAIVGSRFLPGTRLPLYVSAGALGVPAGVFAGWATLATWLWTPLVVGATAVGGEGAAMWLGPYAGQRSWLTMAGCLLVLLFVHVARRFAAGWSRIRVAAAVARWSRWEFWPMWLFYAPVVVWVIGLAIRYRGLSTITAANPGIPDGGTVGESKFEILQSLPPEAIVPSMRVAPGEIGARVAAIEHHAARAGWALPLVLKPDVGQRGADVKLARTWQDVAAYLDRVEAAVLAQPYDPGPFEAGVFYYRRPEWIRGRILAITDKHFPCVVGDGQSTLEALIWNHPRYRMQAATFLRRHALRLSEVIPRGQSVRLALAGNHAQGTLFRDGAHLLTPALETRIDEVARACPGFFIGRFDIRYRNPETFREGREMAIVELNGATAECTSIYDPQTSLLRAYRRLFQQWRLVFAVGDANRRRGARVSSMTRLFAIAREHFARRLAFDVSD